MHIGLLLFPRLTQLDLTAPYEVLSRMPGAKMHLVWKYLDGNVRGPKGEVTHPKAPEDWLRCIVKEHGDVIKVKKVEGLVPDED